MIKKTLVLCGGMANRKKLKIAEITYDGKSCKLKVKGESGDAGIITTDGHDFNTLCDGECVLIADITKPFSVGVVCGDTVLFAKHGENSPSKSDFLSAYKQTEEKSDVNQPYNDYAIASENYYMNEGEISPTCHDTICDIGDFLDARHKDENQNSTTYPQCENVDMQDNYERENDFFNKHNHPIDKESENKKTEQNKGCDCQNENSVRGNEEKNKTYYQRVKDSLTSLFFKFPRVDELEEAIPGSIFVKILYAGEKFYVTGLVEYSGKPEYIVFGIPCAKDGFIPDELKVSAYFVPTNGAEGYYLIYQSAIDGKVIKPA